jgi:HSP20 family protein
MSLATRNGNNTNNQTTRYRDPFSMARDLLSWDPFVARPVSAFSPAVSVMETNDAFVLKADVPGVAESDLDIAVHNNVLSVSGSRQAEERKDGETFSLYERQFGSFSRSFQLPELADGEKIEAKLEHGVLTLTIGKKAEAKPRKIALNK